MRQNYEAVLASEQVFVAEANHKVVAVLVISVTGEGFLLENVAVHPAHAGRGLGRRLLALAEQEAIAQGYGAIHLYTHERMTDNIALNQKVGYQEYARRLEHGYARAYMRKALHAA
jgi:ribosomal protein S18 acetylase RimI-like enzyme